MRWLPSLLLLASSVAAAEPPPPQASDAVTPPQGIPSSFLLDRAYPKEALDRRQEGTSFVQLRVSTKGKVEGCSVEQSSGSLSLDEATCAIARKQRFKPARNVKGEPIEGVAPMRMNWRLPRH
jgi:periplasmic protein TonB